MYNTTNITANLPQVKEATNIKVTTSDSVAEVCKDMESLAQESFQILTINAQGKMIDRHLITLGLVDASLVHPREVLAPVITDRACSFIAVHNHPSGNPTPSAEDLRVTRKLIEAAKIMDINLLDHVIIAKNKNNSLREMGLCQF